MATVELAAALPVLMLLVAVGIGAVQVAGARVRCQDAAREVARATARGDPAAAGLAGRVTGGHPRVAVARDAGTVTITVRLAVRPAGVSMAAVTVTADAVAAVEPAVDGPTP